MNYAAPQPDEYEITVFGPGYGESIVVHLGEGRWVIVDSCISKQTGEPASISYLQSLGVSLDEVQLVVASHWHDDHIRGLAEVLRRCTSATFACSSALNSREFLALASSDDLSGTRLPSGVSEFRKILDHLAARSRAGTQRTPKFASADQVLWERENRGELVRVIALSPSPAADYSARQDIANLTAGTTSKRINIPSLTPNHASVAAVIVRGDDSHLLGADLETVTASDMGWNAVFDNEIKPVRGSTYKVAHHGSENGHHDQIFSDLLKESPVLVLAPFRNGSVKLPTPNDVKRLKKFSQDQVFSTSVRSEPRPVRDRAVTRTLREMKVRIEPADSAMGVVQLRRARGEESWSIGLSDTAGKLS